MPTIAPSIAQVRPLFPDGLVGDVAAYIYYQAPHPNVDIALAGAIGFLAGICGRKYNTHTGAGLNVYILVLALTGRGKEAIAEGIGKLFDAIKGKAEAGEPGMPCVVDFKGPGHFASAEGLLKRLGKSPCWVSIIGEFGIKLRAMAAPNANQTQAALKAALLDLYNKSGEGKLLDPMVYSDTTKNSLPIASPAVTIIGESTPEELFSSLDDKVISNGTLPRFLSFYTEAPRPYLNPNVGTPPSFELVQSLSDLAASCLSYAGGPIKVQLDDEAKAHFVELERLATDFINAAHNSVHTELWNRAYIKALKLACLLAVGVNRDTPVVTIANAKWATDLVGAQTTLLIAKYDNGEIGEVAGNEVIQLKDLTRVIREYLQEGFEIASKYLKGNDLTLRDMYSKQVFPLSYLQRRLSALSSFKNDRLGATMAIDRALKSLLSNDDIREMPAAQMVELFGRKPRSFVVSNAHRFINP